MAGGGEKAPVPSRGPGLGVLGFVSALHLLRAERPLGTERKNLLEGLHRERTARVAWWLGGGAKCVSVARSDGRRGTRVRAGIACGPTPADRAMSHWARGSRTTAKTDARKGACNEGRQRLAHSGTEHLHILAHLHRVHVKLDLVGLHRIDDLEHVLPGPGSITQPD